MSIVWRDQMSVGNHIIDMDHRLLICKINLIELALQVPGEGMSNLRLGLDELKAYTDVHFDREERLQLAVSYPKYDEHKHQHQELVNRLQEIREEILGNNDPSKLVGKERHLTELLRDWLLQHVLKEDMKMRDLFLKYPFNYAP